MPPADFRKLSDEELVYRYVHRNDPAAITGLYDRYGHLVLGVCLHYLKDGEAAKDATQLIFIKLLEDLKRFTIQKFKPWLMQVSRNHCLMQLRKTVHVVNNVSELASDVEFEDEWHQVVEKENLLNQLEKAVTELGEAQRQCIELFYLKKQSYAEVAAATGYDPQDVKSHIQNGKRNLKIKLMALKKVAS